MENKNAQKNDSLSSFFQLNLEKENLLRVVFITTLTGKLERLPTMAF